MRCAILAAWLSVVLAVHAQTGLGQTIDDFSRGKNVVNSLRELTAAPESEPHQSDNVKEGLKTGPAAVDSRSESTTLCEPTSKPNIIFVLMDDMGYADLGCYGAKDIRTPNIDRLAREGLRFTDFYANAPVCTPTRCGFMTGRWQQRVGLEWAMGFTAEQARRVDGKWVPEPDMHALGLPLGETTIATLLKNAGYATGAFGKWHLGYLPQYNPTRRGFDEYFGTLLGHSDYYRYKYYDGTYELRDGEQPVKAEGYLTDLLSRRAVEFIGKHAREPFFLYLPHQAVHAPYQPPGRPDPGVSKEGMNDGDRRIYAAMLERVDEGIGQMLAELDRLELTKNTLFVFSSDNGGAHYSDNTPLFNGKQSVWEGGIRVPCLMRWPARLAAGKEVHQPAITMDLSATFLAAAGGDAAKDRPLDGIDLMPILSGQQPETSRTFYWRINRTGRQQKAIRHGKWKYVLDGGYVNLLFNLEEDTSERRNLAIHHPDIVRDLQRRLADWEKQMDASPREYIVR
jgi:arylsulfatase A-like enzyme